MGVGNLHSPPFFEGSRGFSHQKKKVKKKTLLEKPRLLLDGHPVASISFLPRDAGTAAPEARVCARAGAFSSAGPDPRRMKVGERASVLAWTFEVIRVC